MSGKMIRHIEDLPAVLTISQVQQFLRISRPKAYELAHQRGFPVLRFGRAIRVPRDAFLQWLNDVGVSGR
jgi:excisionase family DNA binding protein